MPWVITLRSISSRPRTEPFEESQFKRGPYPMKQILFALLFLLLQQSPHTAATASIQAVLLKLGTTQPIPRATLTLGQPGSATVSQAVTADDAGNFAFRNAAPGQSRL